MAEDISEKKHAIFESAELIKDHGFHGAPISLVARNPGVAAGTIDHYFRSRELLNCECDQHNSAHVISVMDSSLWENIPVRKNFFRIRTHLYRFYVQQPNVLIFFEQFVNSPFNTSKRPDYSRGPLYNFFVEGIQSDGPASMKPEIRVMLTMGSIHATAKLRVFGKIPLNKTDPARIVGVLWNGMNSPEDPAMKLNVYHLRNK